MWNEPTPEKLAQIPKLYETEHISIRDKIVHIHFFIGGCDWYVVEFDGEDILFCFTILNDDFQCAEWGYVSLAELKSININGLEVDCDLYWKATAVCNIERISVRT